MLDDDQPVYAIEDPAVHGTASIRMDPLGPWSTLPTWGGPRCFRCRLRCTRLYRQRKDAESINRGLVNSLYIGRAHSLGHARQLVNLLGYALMVNSLALHLHRARESLSPAA